MKRKHLLLTLLLAVMVPWAAMGQTQNVFFSDDFEGSSCEWNLINGTHTNQWAWGTATNNGGTHALYVSNDGGESNAYSNNLYSIVYATRLIAFEVGEYTIAYDFFLKLGLLLFEFLFGILVQIGIIGVDPGSKDQRIGIKYFEF